MQVFQPHSTVSPSLCPCTERHPVISVCSHSQKGHPEPAGAGGAGDIQPGVVSGERVGRGGRLHGRLSPSRLCVLKLNKAFCHAAKPCGPCLKKERYTSLQQLSTLMLLLPHVHYRKSTPKLEKCSILIACHVTVFLCLSAAMA